MANEREFDTYDLFILEPQLGEVFLHAAGNRTMAGPGQRGAGPGDPGGVGLRHGPGREPAMVGAEDVPRPRRAGDDRRPEGGQSGPRARDGRRGDRTDRAADGAGTADPARVATRRAAPAP